MAQLQQQQLQRQLLLQQQQMLQQQLAAAASGPNQGGKKQREVYVGNLAIGVINEVILREMFNAALAGLVPDPVTNPPVSNVNIDPSGRYAFVELRSEELATAAVQLDKTEVAGRSINVGRPKGYIEPPTGPVTMALVPGQAQLLAQQLSSGATNVVLMEDLLPVSVVRDPKERFELIEDVSHECQKIGRVEGIAVPLPPAHVPGETPCRVYVKFFSIPEAVKCKDMNNGRLFDERKISVSFTTNAEFDKAFAGEWVMAVPGGLVAGGSLGIT